MARLLGRNNKVRITKELFFSWGELFVAQLPKDDIMPHVLFLDGHSSHIYNLDLINLMKQNNVQVWCFPAHTTHWLQPADRSFFRSLKHNWTEEGLKLARVQVAAKLNRSKFLRLLATSWRKQQLSRMLCLGTVQLAYFLSIEEKFHLRHTYQARPRKGISLQI